MIGFEVGAAPSRLFLPSSLRASNPAEEKGKPGKKPDKKVDKQEAEKKEANKGSKEPNPEWWTKNPRPGQELAHPSGQDLQLFLRRI
jgi:hypothetical protein